MNIILNGQNKELLENNLTLKLLILSMNIIPESVVVELNGEIINNTMTDKTFIKNNDQIEIVHFVGGGTWINL